MTGRRALARNPWIVLAAAIGAAALIVLAVLRLFPLISGAVLERASPPVRDTLLSGLLYGLLALVGWIGRVLAASEAPPRRLLAAAGAGLLIGIGGLCLALAGAALAGVPRAGMPAAGAPGLLLLGTLVTLGQSASEEYYFRGWLQPVLTARWGLWSGLVVTALAFAGLHMAGGARGLLALVNLGLGGLLFGLLAARFGGLFAAIAAHSGWNWAEGILFGLDPNPGVGSFGAIRNLDLAGSAWWGGSPEGLNGSLAMAIVLAALLLPLAMAAGQRDGMAVPRAR